MTPIDAPEDGLNAAVAAELRAERAAQNLTVQELAERSAVPYASLRRYLAGERHIDVAVLSALAAALETSPAGLVAAAEERVERSTHIVSNVTHLRPKTSGAPLSVDAEEPSAAEPERRDEGQGSDDA